MKFSCGLKLWSTNSAYVSGAGDLLRRGVYQYIELFAVPGTFGEIAVWTALRREAGARFVIHAAHYMAGMNLADPARKENNKVLAGEAFRFADALGAEKVIFHPGVNGRDEEAAEQLAALRDPRRLVENKPYAGIEPGIICAGYSPAGIKLIKEAAGAGFCFDVGHALAAAASLGQEEAGWLEQFFALEPAMYHVADGQRGSAHDGHLHLGEGNYDFRAILPKLPDGAMITLETNKKFKDRLDDCEADVRFLSVLAAEGGHD
jgi:deoxyribonuclease-4